MTVAAGLVAFAAGAALGSLANLAIDQLPAGSSPIRLHPVCPSCGSTGSLLQALPLGGSLLVGGRWTACGHPIRRSTLLVEAASGLVALACYLAFGLSWRFLSSTVLLAVALTASVIDSRHQIIPNALTLPCIALGLALSIAPGRPTPLDAVGGLVVAGGLLALAAWVYPAGMGGGDVKFMAAAGTFLGWPKSLLAIFVGSLAGAVVGLAMVGLGRRSRRDPLPFGPFLAVGVLTAVFAEAVGLSHFIWWL